MRVLVLPFLLPPLLLLCTPRLASAVDLTGRDSLTAVLESIPVGKTVRLALLDPAQARYEGTFERFVADTLHVKGDTTGVAAFSVDSVRAVWVRGNAAPKCAAIVGLVAAVAAVAVSGIGSSVESTYGHSDSGAGGGVVLLAGLGGAAIGYALGTSIPTWQQRYPKQPVGGPSRH